VSVVLTVASLTAWIPRRYRDIAQETWDAEYASGSWDYLGSLNELGRYSAIVGYCREFNPRAAVLDIGCGDGILQRLLSPTYSKYLGVDLSQAAIDRASAAAGDADDTKFLRVDARDFVPAERFDVIVFNECLYYFEQPLAIARRYEGCLNRSGIFLVSNVIRRRTRAARRDLQSTYVLLDRVLLQNCRGVRWQVEALSPGLCGRLENATQKDADTGRPQQAHP
jgi:2-polyprenyl-3-methyl-5-hydroxy-6-metoxy-1,4-benzoquinol methylase